jgi:hypothetical protein
MNNPACPTFDCPCDGNPLSGYLSEAPDVVAPLATAYVELHPPFGVQYCDRGCVAFASEVLPPPGSGIAPPAQEFFSSPQSCTVTCPDGTPFVFEVTAGAFTGPTQAKADAAALAYACSQANARQLCLGQLTPPVYIENAPYSGSITASGGGLGTVNTWEIIAGTLPAGLTFNGGTIAGNTVTITGTPTGSGVSPFTIQLTSPSGNTATKSYLLGEGTAVIPIEGPNLDGSYPNGSLNSYIGNGIADCAIISPANYANFTPAGPYTAGYQLTNAAVPGNEDAAYVQTLRFVSATAKTWNWTFYGAGAIPTASDPQHIATEIFIGWGGCNSGAGAVNPTVAANGTFSVSGSFNTDAATEVIVRFGCSPEFIPNNIQFAWQTPS